MFDEYRKNDFTFHATIFCTINDFPAFGNSSGYTVKGAKACPICDEDMIDKRLHHCGKNVYLHYRTLLPLDHPFRKKKKLFNKKVEMREAPVPLRGKEVSKRVKDIETIFGKPFKSVSKNLYKKRSKFWDLPYWECLEVNIVLI